MFPPSLTVQPPFEVIVPKRKGRDNMSEKQKQLVEDILSASEQLPPEKQYQLLGVAQGLGMETGATEKKQADNTQQ